MKSPRTTVAFLHPDLGLGGAERLVVDAAFELTVQGYESAIQQNICDLVNQELGTKVEIFTAFHDPKRSFQQTTDGSFPVTVCGGWFPRTVFNRGHALCAYARCILVALYIAWKAFRRKRSYDVVFVDQVSAVIPFLHMFTSSKVLFYCHHPDLLLALRRPGLHRVYRAPLDWIEQITTGQADKILVNSAYTAEIFKITFRQLAEKGISPEILHPACAVPAAADLDKARQSWQKWLPIGLVDFLGQDKVFLSINRFERKKDVALAIRAFASLLNRQKLSLTVKCKLVIAGGYDSRLTENREYLEELKQLVNSLGLDRQIWFFPSFTDQQRGALLAACSVLLYTPSNEHFGIVPLEAMACGKPVIACKSGGPMESVVHGKTGFLCDPEPHSFSAAMQNLLGNEETLEAFGNDAREHVLSSFSRQAFGKRLAAEMEEMLMASTR